MVLTYFVSTVLSEKKPYSLFKEHKSEIMNAEQLRRFVVFLRSNEARAIFHGSIERLELFSRFVEDLYNAKNVGELALVSRRYTHQRFSDTLHQSIEGSAAASSKSKPKKDGVKDSEKYLNVGSMKTVGGLYGMRSLIENSRYIQYFATEIAKPLVPEIIVKSFPSIPQSITLVINNSVVLVSMHLGINIAIVSCMPQPQFSMAFFHSAGYVVEITNVLVHQKFAIQHDGSIFTISEFVSKCGTEMLVSGVSNFFMSATNIWIGGIANPYQVLFQTMAGSALSGMDCYSRYQKYKLEDRGFFENALPYAVDGLVAITMMHQTNHFQHAVPVVHHINGAVNTLRAVVIADQLTKLSIDSIKEYFSDIQTTIGENNVDVTYEF